MESASAVPRPEASAALPQPEVHAVPTSDGTEIRLTHYRMGTKGPVVLAPGYGNAARAFALDTVPKSFARVPRRARLRRLAARLPREPRPAVELHAVHGRRHRAARLAGGDRRRARARPAPTRCRRWATASAACRCSWRSAAAWRACARRRSRRSPATRSRRRATSCAPACACATVFKRARDQGPEHRLRPEVAPGPRGRAVMRVLPFRHVYDDPVARRIYFIYGDVFDYEHIDEETMRSSVPSFFGNGNITFFEHISLMIRAGEARDAQGGDATSPTSTPTAADHLHDRRAQPDVRPGGPPAHVRHAAPRQRPRPVPPHVIEDYAHLDLWLGTERRARRVPDRPRRAGAPQLMSTTADDRPAGRAGHAGLRDLFSYPLVAALQDRRTRRVAQGAVARPTARCLRERERARRR